MKLDWAVDAWYAWQDGDKKSLLALLQHNIHPRLVARIPSGKWGYQSSSDCSFILTMVMLSHNWSVYKGASLIDSTYWTFDRDGGPPVEKASDLPYRNFIIVRD
jgi:hypothetical protein